MGKSIDHPPYFLL